MFTSAFLWNLIKLWNPYRTPIIYCCLTPGKKWLSRTSFYMLQRYIKWGYRKTEAGNRLKDKNFLCERINNVLKYYVKCTNIKQLLILNLNSNSLNSCFPIFPKVKETCMGYLKIKAIYLVPGMENQDWVPCSIFDALYIFRCLIKLRRHNGKTGCLRVYSISFYCIKLILLIKWLFLRCRVSETRNLLLVVDHLESCKKI